MLFLAWREATNVPLVIPLAAGLLLRELGREAADVLAAHASEVAPPAFMAQVGGWGWQLCALGAACKLTARMG